MYIMNLLAGLSRYLWGCLDNMSNKIVDTAETALNALSILISVQDLNDIINLILLIVSVLAILWRAGYAIYKHIKDKNYDKVSDELDKTKKDIENLKDNVNKEDKQ